MKSHLFHFLKTDMSQLDNGDESNNLFRCYAPNYLPNNLLKFGHMTNKETEFLVLGLWNLSVVSRPYSVTLH
jgi:hypothetical protein